jgi:hypothetical protein
VNTGKAGQTYPVKFRFADASGSTITDTAAVTNIRYQPVTCGSFTGDPIDALETTATGGTVLRNEGGTFIYNWTAPRTAGCYVLYVTLDDGTTHQANFSLRG